MTDVKVYFKFLEDGYYVPISYAYVRCDMISYVEMQDFLRKSRLVAGRHMTETPDNMTYVSFVSRETFHFSLVIAAYNDLEVECGDVLNDYIDVPINETFWTTLRPESGNGAGNREIIIFSLYGLKSAGAFFSSLRPLYASNWV